MSQSKINVLYVIDYFHRTGGTETHLAQLAQRLAGERFDAAVVVFDLGQNPLIEQIRLAGVPVIHVSVGREYTPAALLRGLQLARLVRSRRVDILQTFHQKSDTFGAIFGWLGGARCLISSKRDSGDLRTGLHHFLNRRLQFLFDRIIVVADAVADALVQSECLDRSRMVKIYNGVDTTWFLPPLTADDKSRAKRAAGFEDGDFVVGMVAGFRPEKDHAMFFDAMLEMMSSRPNVRALAVGGGPLLQAFRGRLAASKQASRFHLAGDVSDVRPLLKAMDVGCLVPKCNEGFSNSVLEKMAVGLPLVVTNVGGNAEAVVDGENGWVIAPQDGRAFSAAINQLCDDAELRRSMGRMSRRLAEERFSLETMCRRHEELYDSVLNSRVASVRRN